MNVPRLRADKKSQTNPWVQPIVAPSQCGAASWYGGCYVMFERNDAAGANGLVLGLIFAGIWYAVTSGLNEVFPIR